MKFKKFTDNEKQRMAAEYAEGDGLRVLSQRFGVSIPTMAKYIRAGGGVVRKPGTVRQGNGDYAKMVEAVNEAIEATNAVTNGNIEPMAVEPIATPVRVLLPMD